MNSAQAYNNQVWIEFTNIIDTYNSRDYSKISTNSPGSHFSVDNETPNSHFHWKHYISCSVGFWKGLHFRAPPIPSSPQVQSPSITSLHKVWFVIFQWSISNVVAGDCFYIKVHEDQSRYPLSKPGSEAGHSLLCPVFIIMSCVRGAAEPRYLNCFGYSNQENREASPLSR